MLPVVPAATAADWYPGVLVALFVIASGVTLLQVAANPLVAELGTRKGSHTRLNLSQAFNSLGTTIGPWLGSHVLLTGGVFAAGAVVTAAMFGPQAAYFAELFPPQRRFAGFAFARELELGARKQLIDALRRDAQARVVDLDGWMALPAFVPPNERRGLVLIDPPFEAKDEFERLARAFTEAFAKWPTGAYLLWYPVKTRRATDELARSVAAAAMSSRPAGKCLRLEFSVAPQEADAGLVSTGLLIVNPPWTLANEQIGRAHV